MIFDPAYITDPTFVNLEEAQKTIYVAKGVERIRTLCLQYGIDYDAIPDPAPQVPQDMHAVATLIYVCRDLLGSSWREVNSGFAIDVYKAKLDVLEAQFVQLLGSFTHATCGLETPNINNSGYTFSMVRA